MKKPRIFAWCFLIVVIVTIASYHFGKLIGRTQLQTEQYYKREQVVFGIISGNSKYQYISMQESSSCHLYVHGVVDSIDTLNLLVFTVENAIGHMNMETITIAVTVTVADSR